MTPVGELLRDEIRRGGPISFHRFMEAALYHPEHGYYRRRTDPFGVRGDFYTAEQLQPVFGILMASRIGMLCEPGHRTVVELGAGRGEMAAAFAEFDYRAVDIDRGELPERFRGVVFSNEFFDALPVHRVVWRQGQPREAMVGWSGDTFGWADGEAVNEEIAEYLAKYLPGERTSAEVNLDALRWMDRIARSLERGYVLTIDYGYTSKESVRFPDGTLMSYRRHTASEDVLADPGLRDITAHVCFSALRDQPGLETVRFESLAQTLLAAGEADQFAAALQGPDPAKRRQQLKTLLAGMGETFRVLVQRAVTPA
ncbi:MAG: SAM-dependent methyltransferase [Acidobacteria bacterium]|nr:SAM-dependent methyltransferase [Acidobacteriota bacterium]